jgi:hypothetical protein
MQCRSAFALFVLRREASESEGQEHARGGEKRREEQKIVSRHVDACANSGECQPDQAERAGERRIDEQSASERSQAECGPEESDNGPTD